MHITYHWAIQRVNTANERWEAVIDASDPMTSRTISSPDGPSPAQLHTLYISVVSSGQLKREREKEESQEK